MRRKKKIQPQRHVPSYRRSNRHPTIPLAVLRAAFSSSQLTVAHCRFRSHSHMLISLSLSLSPSLMHVRQELAFAFVFLDIFPATCFSTHFPQYSQHISCDTFPGTCFPRHVSRNICFSQHISRNMFSRNMFLTTHFLRHISCDVPVGIYDAGCVNVPVARTFTYPSPLRPPCLPVYSFTTPSH